MFSGHRLPLLETETGSSSYNYVNDLSTKYISSEKKRIVHEKDYSIDKNEETDAAGTDTTILDRTINKECEDETRSQSSPHATRLNSRVLNDVVSKGGEHEIRDAIEPSFALSTSNRNQTISSDDANDQSTLRCDIVEALVSKEDCHDNEKTGNYLLEDGRKKNYVSHSIHFPCENQEADVAESSKLQEDEEESMDLTDQEGTHKCVETNENTLSRVFSIAEGGEKVLQVPELDSVNNLSSRKRVPSKSEMDASSCSPIICNPRNQVENKSDAPFCSKTSVSLSKRQRVDAPEDTSSAGDKDVDHLDL